MSITARARRRALRLLLGLAAVVLTGNLAIVVATGVARATAPAPDIHLVGVDHLRALDDRVWRGDAPTREGYRNLAAAGVETVVDLRAERDVIVDEARLDDLGIRRVHLPIRDGQVPDDTTLRAALDTMRAADGRVYVHCGAGVGRTGTVAGAWLVREQHVTPTNALLRNLAVGPPSLEQIVFVGTLDPTGAFAQPGQVITAVSRLWDAPRRIFSYL